MAGKVNLSGTGITGTLAVGCGGTGITSVGADGYVLTSNGAGALEYAPPAAGSVISLADYYVDVANTNNEETDLISYTIPADTLEAIGDKMNVFASIHVDEATLGAGTMQLRVYFDLNSEEEPIEVFDSNASVENSNWLQLRIEIVRTGSDTAKISTILSRMENILESAELDEVDFTAGIEFAITGNTSTNVADVFKLKQGSITLTKAPGGNVVGSNGIVAGGDNTFTANNTFENGVILTELGSDPSTPPSGTVQVYAKDGSAWVMDDTGNPIELGEAGGGSGDTSIVSATLPSTSVNNYNPSGFDTATTLLLNLTANSTLTGLVPNNAKTLTIQNVSNYTLTLESDSASSSVGNKFMLDSFLQTATLEIASGKSVVMARNVDYWAVLYHTNNGYITHTAHQIFGSTCGITVSTDGVTITGDGGNNPLTVVGGGGPDLETNGTPNGDQSLLNLVAGSSVTLADNGTGSVTITATGNGGAIGAIGGDPTGSLNVARKYAAAVRLASGQVLIIGGTNGNIVFSTCELYDPETGLFTATGSLATARCQHSAILLADGNVLVAGGTDYSSSFYDSCEIYDSAAGTWSGTGSLSAGRSNTKLVLLDDDTVLSIGGSEFITGYVATCEIYDAGTWTVTDSISTNKHSFTATKLSDGRVLVAGGYSATALDECEIFDAGTWTTSGTLITARNMHTATLLANGDVLIAGGYNTGALDECEIYDPDTETSTATGTMTNARYGANAFLLSNDTVQIVGGESSDGPVLVEPGELFTVSTWSETADISVPKVAATLTLLTDDRILIAGGIVDVMISDYPTTTSELYGPVVDLGLVKVQGDHAVIGVKNFANGILVNNIPYVQSPWTAGSGSTEGNLTSAGAGSGGCYNFFTGIGAGCSTGTGNSNIAIGGMALTTNYEGNGNVAIGTCALFSAAGSYNIGIGYDAGSSIGSGCNNICIGNQGTDDNGIIRIGDNAVHTHTYIAGDVSVNTLEFGGNLVSTCMGGFNINANGPIYIPTSLKFADNTFIQNDDGTENIIGLNRTLINSNNEAVLEWGDTYLTVPTYLVTEGFLQAEGGSSFNCGSGNNVIYRIQDKSYVPFFIADGGTGSSDATLTLGSSTSSVTVDTSLSVNGQIAGETLLITGPGDSEFQENLVVSKTVSAAAFSTAIATKTEADDPYTASTLDSTVIGNVAITETLNVELPTAVGIAGRIYTFKQTGLGTLIIDAAGSETIDGATTKTLATQFFSCTIQSDGSNWLII